MAATYLTSLPGCSKCRINRAVLNYINFTLLPSIRNYKFEVLAIIAPTAGEISSTSSDAEHDVDTLEVGLSCIFYH